MKVCEHSFDATLDTGATINVIDHKTPANEVIKRVRHPIPTVEDIRLELNGAQWFSKLDLSQAYHHLELEEASRYITTFNTHVGLFGHKRLNCGTNAAAGISAILSQNTKEKDDDKVISYASPALTAVEGTYSQTEKEALAIV